MRLEKFYAESMSEALSKIQDVLGQDAVIYSQKSSGKGVEVVAGLIRPDSPGENNPFIAAHVASQQPPQPKKQQSILDQVASMDQNSLKEELARIEKINLFQQKLRTLKFPADFIDEFSHTYAVGCEKEAILNNEIIIKLLFANIPLLEHEVIDTQSICAVIGPTGIGKSTSIAKLAKRFAAKYGSNKLGIISTDFQRIIMKNQFHYFGKLMNIDIKYARNSLELKESISFFEDKQLILIDTAGVSPNDNKKLAELLEGVGREHKEITTYLVLPCNLQSDILNDFVQNFRMSHTRGCIITKKDESQTVAPCLSVVMRHQLPIAYWCDGQNISKDIHLPSKIQVINAIFHGEKSVGRNAVPV